MNTITTRTHLLTEKEYKRVKAGYHSIGRKIEESVMEYLCEEHGVRIDLWLYQYHEETEDKGFKIILADEGNVE